MHWGFLLQGEHEDATLHAQNNAGEWIPVPPVDGTLVCSLGEMLEKETEGLLRATTHRVSPPAAGTGDRMSINFFIGPELEHEARVLEIPGAVRERIVRDVDLAAGGADVSFEGRTDNEILGIFGENLLKGMIRSHPEVAQRYHPELYAVFGYDGEEGAER